MRWKIGKQFWLGGQGVPPLRRRDQLFPVGSGLEGCVEDGMDGDRGVGVAAVDLSDQGEVVDSAEDASDDRVDVGLGRNADLSIEVVDHSLPQGLLGTEQHPIVPFNFFAALSDILVLIYLSISL
jgi:hypothetical protein